jgi:hypothetical protein
VRHGGENMEFSNQHRGDVQCLIFFCFTRVETTSG